MKRLAVTHMVRRGYPAYQDPGARTWAPWHQCKLRRTGHVPHSAYRRDAHPGGPVLASVEPSYLRRPLARPAEICQYRYIPMEITSDLGNEMVDSIPIERIRSNSFLSRPQPAGLERDALRPNSAVLPPFDQSKISRETEHTPPAAAGRRRIWDFDTHLHCSIIGTCLSTAELRHILIKLGLKEATTASEHDLHASGVLLASQRHGGAKLLHKALDRRHHISINQFGKAKTPEGVCALWQGAVRRGEIPGAYWAALTHPATNDSLLRDVFAEVHMLSHLVGAANRADIRRLRQLESEKAELEAKVGRQQQQLRDAVVSRDATIRDLRHALEERIMHERASAAQDCSEPHPRILAELAIDLKRRLDTAETRSERLERQLDACRSALITERSARAGIEKQNRDLREELAGIEATLAGIAEIGSTEPQPPRLLNLTLLYVGGRPAQIGHLREFAERSGAAFLHHDGGIEERGGILQGLVSRADAVLFPVDCVSHSAMLLVKRICRQSGKPILPLRSGGLASFCSALNQCAAIASPSPLGQGA